MKDKNIIITDPARQQLEKFNEEMVRKLLDAIISEKSYPGLDSIEVTAEDIRRYSANMRYVKLDRATRLSFIARAYFFLGFIVLVCGIYLEDLKEMSLYSPLRLSLIVVGALMVFFGVLFLTVVPKRKNREEKNHTVINNY